MKVAKDSNKTQTHIAEIISREVDWMIGWYVSEETRNANFQNAAKKIIKYLSKKFQHRQKVDSESFYK